MLSILCSLAGGTLSIARRAIIHVSCGLILSVAGQGKLAAEERCLDVAVDVAAVWSVDRDLVCAGAERAFQLLGRCNILPQRPVQVQVLGEVRHPLSGAIFGYFDIKEQRISITRFSNMPALMADTPYSGLSPLDFYMSLVVHEVVHSVMHQNLKRPVLTQAAYEYPAYALQIMSLPADARARFLRSFDPERIRTSAPFSDVILSFDPYFFAARAYQHFSSLPDGCAGLRAVMEGEVDFIVLR